MARLLVLGAGISGHTAALVARRRLPAAHRVAVVSPLETYNWIPSNIWVGVGVMAPSEVLVPLRPVYEKTGVDFVQGRAVELRPDGSAEDPAPHVVVETPDGGRRREPYDYLINATGPKLNFAATPGLGPSGFSHSVCTSGHAADAARGFLECVERLKRGERQTLVVGMGHGTCTCEGAAFEYVFNVEFELRRHGVRDKARLVFLTNEAELGDFGVDGLRFRQGGYVVHSRFFAESLFAERGVERIVGAHVREVQKGRLRYSTLDGGEGELAFDFAMLLPPFTGVGLKAAARDGRDLTAELFAPSGFMKVDADYAPKDWADWRAGDWPRTYASPSRPNLFAVGIAFAPPHAISRPRRAPDGTPISPAPPRTGMPSAIIGRAAALNAADLMLGRADRPRRTASMAELGAACVASAGAGWWSGTAASMTMYPIVPDYERYPEFGRDLDRTFGEIGSAGHWIKQILHRMFLYKARAKPGWWLIPE
ncbi:MAG: FAD-dependent oxidoreductase [Elusimicrobia bacterium]|nr:FAD-dependent oxidoreductase [Elusimicrobiota bacterium]